MAIITADEVMTYLRHEVTEDIGDVAGVVATVEDLCESVCGRKWVVASGSSVRYYAPRSRTDVIRIHDAVSVTSVTNDGQALSVASSTTSGYQLEPLNGIDWTGEARPYESIRYINHEWKFDGYRATVAVTGSWGWVAIPEQVKRGALVLAKDVWTYRDQPPAGLDEFLYKKAAMLLKRYRREEAKAGIGGPI